MRLAYNTLASPPPALLLLTQLFVDACTQFLPFPSESACCHFPALISCCFCECWFG